MSLHPMSGRPGGSYHHAQRLPGGLRVGGGRAPRPWQNSKGPVESSELIGGHAATASLVEIRPVGLSRRQDRGPLPPTVELGGGPPARFRYYPGDLGWTGCLAILLPSRP